MGADEQTGLQVVISTLKVHAVIVPNRDIRDLFSLQWSLLALFLRVNTAEDEGHGCCSCPAMVLADSKVQFTGYSGSVWSPLCGDVVHVSLGCDSGLVSFIPTGVR